MSATRPLTGAERQSARAGGPRGRADRAKSASRRTYRASNSVVRESQLGRIIAGTGQVLRSDAVTTQPPPGPPAPSSGRCANASEVEPAERHTERHKPNPARTVRSLSLSQRDNATRLVRFCCVKRRARSPPCSAGADCGDSFPGQELMRSSSQRRRNLSVRETDFHSRRDTAL